MSVTQMSVTQPGDSLSNVVAANVRAEIARANLTRQEVARRIGISGPGFSLKLKGNRPITLEEVGKLAAVFGVAPADLLREWAPWGSNPQPTD